MSVNDLINTQAEDLMIEAMKTREPTFDLRPGTPLHDLLIGPMLPAVAAIVEQVKTAETKRTMAGWYALSNTEVDAAAARFFTVRHPGNKAQGSLRLSFSADRALSLGTNVPFVKDGRQYFPSVAVSIANLVRSASGTYHADVSVIAAENGLAYNSIPGTSFTYSGLAGDSTLLGIVASSPIQGGRDDESNGELYARARKGLYVRNLVNAPSVDYVLRENFPNIGRLLVVGGQDDEMRRDVRRIVDPVAGNISLHLGNHSDIYVQTPITRRLVEIPVPAGSTSIDLQPYRALLKVHSAMIKGTNTPVPAANLIDTSLELRYSALDPVRLTIEQSPNDRTVVLDISYMPEVVAIHDWVNSADVRLTMANIMVRSFIPVWLSGTIDIDNGATLVNEGLRFIGAYIGRQTNELIISRLTEALHTAQIGLVHQDYDLTVRIVFGDNSVHESSSDTILRMPNLPDKGFTPRVGMFVVDGVLLNPLS